MPFEVYCPHVFQYYIGQSVQLMTIILASIMLGCGLALFPVVIRKDHGQLLIESAQYTFCFNEAIYCGTTFIWLDLNFIYSTHVSYTYIYIPCRCISSNQLCTLCILSGCHILDRMNVHCCNLKENQ